MRPSITEFPEDTGGGGGWLQGDHGLPEDTSKLANGGDGDCTAWREVVHRLDMIGLDLTMVKRGIRALEVGLGSPDYGLRQEGEELAPAKERALPW